MALWRDEQQNHKEETVDPRKALARHNILMVLLCALCAFWLLASPLVPVAFDPSTGVGMALFVAALLSITALLSTLGIRLNHLASRRARVTLRSLLGPWWRS